MSDLINRQDVINLITRVFKNEENLYTAGVLVGGVVNIPTVEAVPVVRGEWIKGDMGEWKCSVCGEENCYAYDENLQRFTDSYCPNCGADMRKE